MLFKIGVLQNFANFKGKHLCWSLFLILLQIQLRFGNALMHNPLDDGSKLNASKMLKRCSFSEHLMYVQFTSWKLVQILKKKITDDLKPWDISVKITAPTNLTSNQKDNSKFKIIKKSTWLTKLMVRKLRMKTFDQYHGYSVDH